MYLFIVGHLQPSHGSGPFGKQSFAVHSLTTFSLSCDRGACGSTRTVQNDSSVPSYPLCLYLNVTESKGVFERTGKDNHGDKRSDLTHKGCDVSLLCEIYSLLMMD